MKNLSRRGILGGGAVSAALAAGTVLAAGDNGSNGGASTGRIPFRAGSHQQGITTAAQDRIVMAAFNLTTTDPAALRDTLTAWTVAAEQMTAGRQITEHTPGTDPDSPDDTGETLGDQTGRLTITIGYGPGLYAKLGIDPPAKLVPLPAFPGDSLDPNISGGDLVIQACSDDPQVAFHVVHNLNRLATGVLGLKWVQTGFGRTSSTSPAQATPRNLMGFKDGTRNVRADETHTLTDWVWADEQGAMAGGSYMVVRKIKMRLNKWDADGLDDQEQSFGRHKTSGASFGRTAEFDTPDFHAMPATAHVRLAAPENNGGLHILRRGYSFEDGVDGEGGLNAGLFFVAFMRDPAQFVALQSKLAAHDDLTTHYLIHEASAVFAIPRGLGPGETWGTQLLGPAPILPTATATPIPDVSAAA